MSAAIPDTTPASAPEPTPVAADSTPAPITKTSPITLRAPSSLPSKTDTSIVPPTLSWFEGTWDVTHSSLPMWKKNKNVQITYKRIAGTSPAHIDDIVSYQPINSSKSKTVHGVDKPFDIPGSAEKVEGEEERANLGYGWRGKGWLVIATSKWELLGYGTEEGTGVEWAVTHFAKTLFTPPGVDVYARKGHLKEQTLDDIKGALAGLGGDVAKVAKDIFQVAKD
ncbi:hypothetical protein BDV96DRAFT_647585 [Lophiotrema nucula]|uniref:Calycin-like protein n=1 Tax=Lophiotrema nucula TaxID=690887 RepID=A0A6A5Z3P3_9PLEO|nr:hypothetical protein BDV96DRAFT_647585 [Lophiotrema nucula]